MSNEEIDSQPNTTSAIAAKKLQASQYTTSAAMEDSPFVPASDHPVAAPEDSIEVATASIAETMAAGGLVEGMLSGELSEGHVFLSTPTSSLHQHSADDANIDLSTLPAVPIGEFGTFVPTVGQVFGDFPEIEALLDAFARTNSFMIIIMRSQRPGGHVVQATFGCYKSGSYRPNKMDTPNKRTIKTNCPFQINVRYSEKAGNYRITKVDLEHNHDLDMSDVKSNIVKKSNKRRSSISAEGSLESANGEGLNVNEGSLENALPAAPSLEGTPKTPKKPRKARKSKSKADETPVSSHEDSTSATATPFDDAENGLGSDALSMSILHELSNGVSASEMQQSQMQPHHHHHHHHHHHLLLPGEEILGNETANEFDLLSGLELPEEIAQEVSAAMQYHMESHEDPSTVSTASSHN